MRMIRWIAIGVGFAGLATAMGCSAGPGEDLVGVAEVAITQVPTDGSVGCIKVKATGATSVTQSFDVQPGQSTTLSLQNLPTGTVRFVGDAYAGACSAVTSASVPTWTSSPVLATVGTTPVFVTLEMKENGQATVGVDFPDASCRTTGEPCLSGSECCSSICVANACATSSPATECSIGGVLYPSGTVNPADACQVCAPSTSTTAWSNEPDGTACASGKVCSSGSCAGDCFIGGTLYPAGTVNPANPCQVCTPTTSATTWSNGPDGTTCGNGQVCSGGMCGSECFIDGTLYATGTVNPADACQVCAPSTSTTAWSNEPDGTACAGGEVCSSGSCAGDCFIGGTLYPAGTVNPANACQACTPATSTTAWSNGADGTICGSGQVCSGGTCVSGCDAGNYLCNGVCISNQSACLTGAITFADGTSTAGATIDVCVGNTTQTSAPTTSSGQYAMALAPAAYNVAVAYTDGAFSTFGHGAATNLALTAATTTIENVQIPTIVLSGLIVDTANNPVPGVTLSGVAFAQGSCVGGVDQINPTSDSTGHFTVRMLPNSYLNLVLTPPASGPYITTALPDETFSQSTTQTFVVDSPVPLSGDITFADGTPTPNATVSVCVGNTTQTSSPSTATGAFSMGVAPATYNEAVAYTDGAFSTFGRGVATNLTVSAATTQAIQLPTIVLSGLVVDTANNPVPGATLSGVAFAQGSCVGGVDQINATSDSTGHFTVRMLPNNYLNLVLTPPASSPYVTTPLPDQSFSQTKTQTFVLESPVPLSGDVTFADGTPTPGATVSVCFGNTTQTSAPSAADGTYSMGVAPGTYDVAVAYTDGAFSTFGRGVATDLALTSSLTESFELPTIVLSGRIVDPANNPVPGVTFSGVAFAQGSCVGGVDQINATSDANGQFTVRMLPNSYLNLVLTPPASGPYLTTSLPNQAFSQTTTQTFVVQ